MKIAVCFAGFLRSFPVTISNWNFRLNKIDCDVFIHSPNTYYAPLEENQYDSKEPHIVDPNFITSSFRDKLKGLHLYSYDSNIFKEIINKHSIPPNNHIGQYSYRVISYQYNIQETVKMVISSGTHYDYIMITRGDLNLYTDFDFSNINNDIINYPLYHGLSFQGEPKLGVAGVFGTSYAFNDQIFIGNFDKVSVLKNIYDCIPSYNQEGIIINSETLLGFHYLKHNIFFGTNDFIKYDILRFAKQ